MANYSVLSDENTSEATSSAHPNNKRNIQEFTCALCLKVFGSAKALDDHQNGYLEFNIPPQRQTTIKILGVALNHPLPLVHTVQPQGADSKSYHVPPPTVPVRVQPLDGYSSMLPAFDESNAESSPSANISPNLRKFKTYYRRQPFTRNLLREWQPIKATRRGEDSEDRPLAGNVSGCSSDAPVSVGDDIDLDLHLRCGSPVNLELKLGF